MQGTSTNKPVNNINQNEEQNQMQGFQQNDNEEYIEQENIDEHFGVRYEDQSIVQNYHKNIVQDHGIYGNQRREDVRFQSNPHVQHHYQIQQNNTVEHQKQFLNNKGQKLNIQQEHYRQNLPIQQESIQRMTGQTHFITQQTQQPYNRTRVIINGKQPSPNRFYSQNQKNPIQSKSITPPKPVNTMSFGKLIPQAYNVTQTQAQQRVNITDRSTSIRSRIVSEKQIQPIILQQPIKPQSSIIPVNQTYGVELIGCREIFHTTNQQPYFQINNQNQAQIRSMIKQQKFVRQQQTSKSPNYTNIRPQILINQPMPVHRFQAQSNSEINSRRTSPVPITTFQQPPSYLPISPVTKPTSSPNPTSTIFHTSNETTARTLTRYENITIRLQSITKNSQTVTQLINIMLKGQKQQQKQEFIKNLLKQHNILDQNLFMIIAQLNKLQTENKELRSTLSSQSNRLHNNNNTITQQNSESQLAKLRISFEKLNKQHKDVLERYQILQQSTISHPVSQQPQLLKTIQSQKQIIKRLEQQLMQKQTIQIKNSRKIQKIDNKQEINAVQSKYLAIIDSKQAYINELQAQIIRHKTQIKSLKQQIVKQRNQKSVVITGEEQAQLINEINKQKNGPTNQINYPKTIQKLNKIIKQKNEQVQSLKQKIFQLQDQYDHTVDQKDQKINQLHQKIIFMSQRNNIQILQSTSKLQTQIYQLQNLINQKQKQLSLLKTQVQLKSSLQLQIESIKNSNLNLSQNLKIKNQQEQHWKLIINDLQMRLRKQNRDEEVKIMVETIRNKDSQNIKLRQAIQLHLNTIDELSNQIQGLKQGYRLFQAGIQEQRRASSQRVNEYQNRIKSLEKKNEAEYYAEQHQVQKLKKTIVNLQQNIRKFEESQVQRITSPQKEGQIQQPDFRNQYSDSHIKIFELQADVKAKQNKIRQLESHLQTLKLKIGHNTMTQEDFIVNQQIETLRKKIAQYESGSAQTAAKKIHNYKKRDYQISSLFQQKIIYQLKEQNQRLKSMIFGNGQYKKPSSVAISPKKQSHIRQHSSLTTVQKRLHQFNQKLQQLLKTNRSLQNQHNPHLHLKPAPLNYQLVNVLQQQKQSLIRKYNRQIQTLQSRLIDIQRYCAELQYQHTNQNISIGYSYIDKKAQQNNLYSQQIIYYKSKNKQLQQRVDNLLILNRQLKDKLQLYMKPQDEHNSQYYKKQYQQLNTKITDLQNLIKTLTKQKTNLLNQIQKYKSDNSSQSHIQSLQHKILQLNSFILRLQNHNNSLQNQLKKYTQQVINYTTEILNNKGLISQYQNKILSLERENKKYDSKMWEKDQTITKLSNQIQILKAQIQRLNEIIKDKKGDADKQAGKLKGKINQLQLKIKQLQKRLDDIEHDNNSKDQIIVSLNLKLQTLDNSYREQVQKSHGFVQKMRQYQNKLKQAEDYIVILINQNKQLKSLSQRQGDIIKSLQNQLLQARLQLDSTNPKVSKCESRIVQLQQIVQNQKEQLEQLRRIKFQLTQQNQQLQGQKLNLNKIIEKLNVKINQLQNIKLQFLENIRYQMELIRSIFVEVQVLIGQIRVQAESQQANIIYRIREEVQKGFSSCSRIQDKV